MNRSELEKLSKSQLIELSQLIEKQLLKKEKKKPVIILKKKEKKKPVIILKKKEKKKPVIILKKKEA